MVRIDLKDMAGEAEAEEEARMPEREMAIHILLQWPVSAEVAVGTRVTGAAIVAVAAEVARKTRESIRCWTDMATLEVKSIENFDPCITLTVH